MKNKTYMVGFSALSFVLATMVSASAAITTAEAEAAILEGKGFAEVIGVASFTIAAVWLVVRIVKKGIRGAA
jgi:tellurite resistance protein TehA-like permease